MFSQPIKTAALLSITALLLIFISCNKPAKPVKETVKLTRTLTVTSDSAAVFNMRLIGPDFKNGSDEYLLQDTPLELQIKSQDVRMIFKKISGQTPVKYTLSDSTGSITGSWQSTVMIIDNKNMEVFGM